MKCYVCEQLGIDREATGICTVCGMGLCPEHMVRADVHVGEGYPLLPLEKSEKAHPADSLS